MTLIITSPLQNASLADTVASVAIQGNSVQSVNGVALAAQAFTVNWDISQLPSGTISKSITNSSGDSATLTLTKQAPIVESADGTVVSDLTSHITDINGHAWTLHDTGNTTLGKVVYLDGAAPATGTSQNVVKLVYKNHKVYQVNVNSDAWYWDGTTPWNGPFVDPSATESASGSTLTSAGGKLFDASLNAWSLYSDPTNGLIAYKNGAAAGTTSHLATLLYYSGSFYVATTANAWSKWNGTSWVTVAADPRLPVFVESAEGTVVANNTSSLTDATGNVWSLHAAGGTLGNVVYENGVAPALGTSQNVTKLVYHSHKVYQVNVNDDAWYWDGVTPWVGPVADPAPVVGSADGSSINSSTGSLTDAAGNVYTLYSDPTYGLVAYENGAQLGNTDHVTLMVYSGGKIYTSYDDNSWWVWNTATGWTQAASDPRAVVVTPPPTSGTTYNCPVQPTFYGINGHFDWGGSGVDRQTVQPNAATYAKIIAAMQDTGMRTFRNGFGGWGGEVAVWLDFINTYATPAGICVYPNIEGDYGSAASESAAYTIGYNIGVSAAGLKGKVPFYELDNELDSWVINSSGVDGSSPSHYNNARFQIIRGYLLGIMAGVRSVDANAKFQMGGITWTHFAFTEMLWNGTQPDGTTGHPTVRFDINAAHFYLNNNSGTDNPLNLNGGMNWLAKVAEFGVPVRISEFGANNVNGAASVWSSETALANAITAFMLVIYNNRATYNIIGVDLYEVTDAAGDTSTPQTGSGSNEMQFGVMDVNFNHKGRYAIIKAFIAAHAA